MVKLPVLKPKQVIRKFEKLGFIKDRQAGSHLVMYRNKDKKRAVILLHVRDLAKGTLLAILRESGIGKDEFLNV